MHMSVLRLKLDGLEKEPEDSDKKNHDSSSTVSV